MDFDTKLREILGLDHEPYVGVKHCSNCLAFNAIKQLIESKQPEKAANKDINGGSFDRYGMVQARVDGYNAAIDAWREGLNL